MTAGRYPVPAGVQRVEEEIKRSRFITTVGPAPTLEAARAFIAQVSAEFADASHNCWAYVVGPPGSTSQVGMSDAGEPHGTAGRPMLNVLLHSGVGDIVAVVTRYFGGTLLGTGGLVKAYSGGVQLGLQTLPVVEKVAMAEVMVVIDYSAVTPFQRLLPDYRGRGGCARSLPPTPPLCSSCRRRRVDALSRTGGRADEWAGAGGASV